MRYSELRIDELLEFKPAEGKILLKGSRVLIFDASSLGKLRKDLINTLGMDRAKGFLIRYGWSCGYDAAMSIKEQFTWDSELDWVLSGPSMHTLTGHALVTPTSFNIDRQGETWAFTGEWHNSYEAEQHIFHFGLHSESVCWTLLGYAGGFASAYLGKMVVYKEVKCAGRGDDYCQIIGKTVDEWGEEITPELCYYEENKISEELEAAHERIMTQNKILEQIVKTHDQLTECILNGKGIDEITSILAKELKCTVVLEDMSLHSLCTSFPEQTANLKLLSPYLSLSNSPSFKKASNVYFVQKRPFQLSDYFLESTIYRLVSPVIVGNQILSFLSLIRQDSPFSDMEIINLEHSASFFALKILEERKIADVERRLKGDFIDDLLTAKISDPNSILKRARALNYDITLPHRVLELRIHNFRHLLNSLKQDEKHLLHVKGELVKIIQWHLDKHSKGIVVDKGDKIIMLVQLAQTNSPENETREFTDRILEYILDKFPQFYFTIGIGHACNKLEDYYNSLLSAEKSIKIGQGINKKNKVVSLEQFGLHALLFSAINPEDLRQFANNMIGPLIAYDASFRSQFIVTLREFVSQGGNIERTARSMSISVSGLKYRLHRIEELTSLNLKDSQTVYNFHLALDILQVMELDTLSSPAPQ